MKKIFSFNSNLSMVTGVQKVLMDIHLAIKDTYPAKIVGTIDYTKVHKELKIEKEDYLQWRNPFMFRDSIVILHERKFLPVFWILNHLFFQRISVVYIHHSIFNDKKSLFTYPETVVAIADRGIENLHQYFGVPLKNIHKIHNAVRDAGEQSHKIPHSEDIKVLYPARITNNKRQTEIVRQLKGKLDPRIKILFAGVGNANIYSEFLSEVKDEKQFIALGFRDDIIDLQRQCDYMLLFSSYEGLPITLIEAAMCGTPIVCNDVGGNTEIAKDGQNAFIVQDWEDLIKTLNSLPDVSEQKYNSMSKESRTIYEQEYTFETFKNRYLKLLESLM